MSRLKEKFLHNNKGKNVKLVFSNGFQMIGQLIDYDEDHVLIDTNAYSSPPVTILQASINVFIPLNK